MNVRHMVKLARTVKEGALERDPAHGDVIPEIVLERGGRIIAIVYCMQGDPKWAAHALLHAIPGFDASEAVLLTDGFSLRTDSRDPRERPFYFGEFQDRWARGEREGMTEIISMFRGRRGSRRFHTIGIPYVHDVEKGTVDWGEEEVSERSWSEDQLGRMPRHLIGGFEQPPASLTEPIDYRDFGITEREARIHADCGMMRALLMQGYAVALSSYDELSEEIITGTLRHIEEEGLVDMDLLRETIARYRAGEFL
jgi:hypothetical protein